MKQTEMLAIMYSLQNSFNKKVHPQWWTQKYDWRRAIIAEASEAGASFNSWKWWKAGKDDFENYKVEIVDLWHFVMAKDIEDTLSDPGLVIAYNMDLENPIWNEYTEEMFDDHLYQGKILQEREYCLKLTDNFLAGALDHDTAPLQLCVNILNIWTKTCGTVEELYKLYIGKNALNIFRQDNGYKDGTYKKIWNGKEDNVVMMEVLDNLTPSPTLLDEVYTELKKVYTTL